MRRGWFGALVVVAALSASAPASADHTGGRCDVPSVTYTTVDGAGTEFCYPDGRVGAGAHDSGAAYVFWDPASHVITPAHGYALVYVDGRGATACSSAGTWKRGDPVPQPGPGSGSCYKAP